MNQELQGVLGRWTVCFKSEGNGMVFCFILSDATPSFYENVREGDCSDWPSRRIADGVMGVRVFEAGDNW